MLQGRLWRAKHDPKASWHLPAPWSLRTLSFPRKRESRPEHPMTPTLQGRRSQDAVGISGTDHWHPTLPSEERSEVCLRMSYLIAN
jgi:hypothetical protein